MLNIKKCRYFKILQACSSHVRLKASKTSPMVSVCSSKAATCGRDSPSDQGQESQILLCHPWMTSMMLYWPPLDIQATNYIKAEVLLLDAIFKHQITKTDITCLPQKYARMHLRPDSLAAQHEMACLYMTRIELFTARTARSRKSSSRRNCWLIRYRPTSTTTLQSRCRIPHRAAKLWVGTQWPALSVSVVVQHADCTSTFDCNRAMSKENNAFVIRSTAQLVFFWLISTTLHRKIYRLSISSSRQVLSRYRGTRCFNDSCCYLTAQTDYCVFPFDYEYNAFMNWTTRFVRNCWLIRYRPTSTTTLRSRCRIPHQAAKLWVGTQWPGLSVSVVVQHDNCTSTFDCNRAMPKENNAFVIRSSFNRIFID